MSSESSIFDYLKAQNGFDSDIQLMNWLEVSKPAISGIRTGRLPMGENIRFLILDKWWTQLRHRQIADSSTVPDGEGAHPTAKNDVTGFNAEALLKAINTQLATLGTEANPAVTAGDSGSKSADGELLGAYKALKGCATDTELANLLGIKRQSVSMVRSGRNGLGPLPLLRIYEDLVGGDEFGLQSAVQSSDALLNLLTLGKATPNDRP